jgi:hypothetical protein
MSEVEAQTQAEERSEELISGWSDVDEKLGEPTHSDEESYVTSSLIGFSRLLLIYF